jgi:hypothetical protein
MLYFLLNYKFKFSYISNIKNLTSDILYQISDVRCKMFDFDPLLCFPYKPHTLQAGRARTKKGEIVQSIVIFK